ncbi:hypothetical protein [Acidithiobacillus ferrooxidans]|uniref:hypothetical protein n=1 Tax=Acidithiobacillus ferrooxidans TaxID=920 RepID=UPI0006747661|nr:hypothetical protein [Acidithiobacillus ferrooxidans]
MATAHLTVSIQHYSSTGVRVKFLSIQHYYFFLEGEKFQLVDYKKIASIQLFFIYTIAEDFRVRFGQPLDAESLNQSHQIIIVAASLDEHTERIVSYLSKRDIPINVLCFQVFQNGEEQILSRSWLLDPAMTQISAATSLERDKEPWNGEFYVSFGDGPSRSWKDAVEYGFICAGGGTWYSRTLQLLNPGDRIWVKAPGFGFVGVGVVTGEVRPIKDFMVTTGHGDAHVYDVAKGGSYHWEYADDPERCEYFVPVKWLQTVPAEQGVQGVGLFGNQNSVCKPTTPKWRYTVDQLKLKFPSYSRDGD